MSTDPLWINHTGGAPAYAADELRRNMAALLYPGVTDRLGARAGVRPGGTPAITLSGQTISVHPTPVTVYPGLSSTDGPYVGHLLAETHTLDPADGANDRIDIVVIRVYDDDHDSSGRRELVTEYIAGTPAPSPAPPTAPAGTVVAAIIEVPAGGSPSPTLEYVAPFTVASGGVLPVRNNAEGPVVGLYEGALRYRQDSDTLEVWDGSQWRVIGRPDGPPSGWTPIADGTIAPNSGPTSIDVTAGGKFPAGTFSKLRLQGIGDLDGVGSIRVRVNGQATNHRCGAFTIASTGAFDNQTFQTGTGQWVLAFWNTDDACNVDCTIFDTDGTNMISYQSRGSKHSGNNTDQQVTLAWGKITPDPILVSSLELRPFSNASNLFGSRGVRWWLEGYR